MIKGETYGLLIKQLYRTLLLCTVFCNAAIIHAQQTNPIIIGEKQNINSSILGESRDILISAPGKILNPLPLILVFDASGLFEPAVTATRFMNSYSELPQIPEAVVIGILNTDRNRDMPVPQQYGSAAKSEEKFLQFIKEELLPWAKKKYNLNGHVIAIGHSQGAYFVSYLMVQQPQVFPWIISIDAPIFVNDKGRSFSEMLANIAKDNKNKIRYASIEAIYGWQNQWGEFFSIPGRTLQIRTSNETHESVAYKAVYDGLHFLFNDFQPKRKDFNLSELKDHFNSISNKYGYNYEIPLRVLLASAERKRNENRKQEVLELANYAEKKYGSSVNIVNLQNAASMMSEDGASILDSFLTLSRPSIADSKPFLGVWSGVISRKQTPPPGVHLPQNETVFTVEISVVNSKPVLQLVNPPWAQNQKVEMEIFHITKSGEIIYGFRNRGAGLIIFRARINKKGNLEGSQNLVGAHIPAGIPEEDRKMMEFLHKNPATFEFIKQ